MEEATAKTGKLMNKRAVNINHGPKQAAALQQVEESAANPDKSPPRKKTTPSMPPISGADDMFEATAASASREVSMLFLKFAEVLSERAAGDTLRMEELDTLLRKALSLESYLIEKKHLLRQTLSHLSDQLKG